ncbi:MAG: hypothetical protein FWE30_01285 [Bacteroidales bacterium]|nr:hypothetical protein [Bacteroidales bacterium]
MNNTTQDPLQDFFTSEWETSLLDVPSLSPDFSEAVLKKIADNKRQERLFNLACILLVSSGIIAMVVFVYPGYKQFPAVVAGIASLTTGVTTFITEIISSLGNMFRLQLASDFISIPLLTYLSLLTAVLWTLDGLLRKRRESRLE